MPRQTIRTPEVEADILNRLSIGTPLAVICRDEGMPHVTTWGDWVAADENLAIAYARAREIGFDAIATDCLDIADNTANDTRKAENGDEQPNTEWITRSRLRVETRLKLLAKWDPKRYGEAALLKIGDNEGGKLDIAAAIAAGNKRVADGDGA